ncbi:MAG TPA: sodium:solute symporter family protein [Woeseiaceae bacterium]
MNAYAYGILISIAIYLVVGNYAGRRVKHLDDYFVAGRQAPTLLVVGTLVASLLSTAAFLGEVGMAYSGHGTVVLMLVAINVTGYVAGALLFGRHLRRSRALTVAEYFGQRFASRRVQVAAGLTIIVGLGAYLVAVTQGAALIVTRVSDVSYPAALAAVWLGYTVFTMYSGSRGVVITDTIMFLLFSIVAYCALAFVVVESGGWFETIDRLATYAAKPDIIAWHGVTGPGEIWGTPGEALTWAVILGVAWSVVVAVSPWQASRYLMARNEHTVLRAACGASLALLFMYPVLMLCGAAINLSKADIQPVDTAIIWAAQNLMPTFAGVLLMAGIMAAALSSATTFLSLVGFSASNDVVRHAVDDEAKLLRISRLCMLGIGVMVLMLALALPPRIFWITYFAGTVFASSWGPVAFMSVWSRRITADAAFWGIIVGFGGNIVTKALSYFGVIGLPVWADPIILGAALSTVTIILVSRRGTVSKEEQQNRLKLHVIPESERDANEIRLTRRWPVLLIVGGVVLSSLMIAFWVYPYRAGVHAGSLFGGELWLSIGCGMILVASGIVVRRYVRNA